jgi:alpha-ketoglutarate-dependent taurine dioxygenase
MVSASSLRREPLRPTGCLDKYNFFEATPRVGRQYTDLQLRDLLYQPNADELIREFAVIVSQRGVVFLRNQDMTLDEQKTIAQKLGILTGKPKEAGLHVHPSVRATTDRIVHAEAQADPHAFLVSNRLWDLFFGKAKQSPEQKKWEKKNSSGASQWHSE